MPFLVIEHTLSSQCFIHNNSLSLRLSTAGVYLHNDVWRKLLELVFGQGLGEKIADIPTAHQMLYLKVSFLYAVPQPKEAHIHALGSLGIDGIIG